MHADESEQTAREIVAKALSISKRFPPWTVISLVSDQTPLYTAMQSVGFRLHRTLMQMVLEL
jgi:hypothetical protein